MKLERTSRGWWLSVTLAAFVCGTACKASGGSKPEPVQTPQPAAEEPASADEQEPPAETGAPVIATRPEAAEVEIDPARMPVEEDFVEEAASRIGRSANLRAELDRIAAEIKAGRN